jgi:hypothetical protein
MSAGGAFGGARGVAAKAPEKGVFPLDHFGECTEVRSLINLDAIWLKEPIIVDACSLRSLVNRGAIHLPQRDFSCLPGTARREGSQKEKSGGVV